MGIHDREYYRDETRGGLLFSGDAPACRAIIIANVIAFVLQKLYAPTFDNLFTASADQIFSRFPEVWRLLTATFLHASPWHILMNMWFLWMVGREMEHVYGTRDFLAFYLSAAVVSTLAWAICDYFASSREVVQQMVNSPGGVIDVPGQIHRMLGASGAVMAVVVVFTLFYPHREVYFFLFPVEMWFLLVFYIGFDLLNLLTQSQAPVAYASHLGGAAFGYLFKLLDLRFSTLERWAAQRRRPKLRVVAPDPPKPTPVVRPTVAPTRSSGMASSTATTRPAPVFVIPEEQMEEKLDAILAKIAREGKAALSEEDNRILDEASRRFRDRRSERI